VNLHKNVGMDGIAYKLNNGHAMNLNMSNHTFGLQWQPGHWNFISNIIN
jgi:hypothetical protein